VGEEKWDYASGREGGGMKALFLMPDIHECRAIMNAWESCNLGAAKHVTYDITGEPQDAKIVRRVRSYAPDVIFYIGGTGGSGLLRPRTFKWLRSFAPTIHLCWDSGDEPWFTLLSTYKERGCFDLQVVMKRAFITPSSPRCQ